MTRQTERVERLPFAIAAVVLVSSLPALWQEGKLVLMVLSGLLLLGNIAALRWIAVKRTAFTVGLSLANAAFAVSLGFDLLSSGKQYLPFVWFFAALALVVGAGVQWRKLQTTPR